MINKDYILRLAEQFGRELAIIIGLRQRNQFEESLYAIDEMLLRTTGFTSSLINTTSEETLLDLLAPLGNLNVEKCLWIIVLLNEEGESYVALERPDDAYYRYLKSLNLTLELLARGYDVRDIDLLPFAETLLNSLEDYEIPAQTREKLSQCYERAGWYARAEDILFEAIEDENIPDDEARRIVAYGRDFYRRLLGKSNADLQAGNLSKAEVQEGLTALERLASGRALDK
jgi:hypothetical protein